MQQRGVVPDHDIAHAILEAALIFGLRRMGGKLVEQRDGFIFWHPDDTVRAARYRIQRSPPGDRMLPRDWMRDQRHLRFLLIRQWRSGDAARLVLLLAVAVVMNGEQRRNGTFHRIG